MVTRKQEYQLDTVRKPYKAQKSPLIKPKSKPSKIVHNISPGQIIFSYGVSSSLFFDVLFHVLTSSEHAARTEKNERKVKTLLQGQT